MSDPSSSGSSRLFLVGALTVMVLGLAWSSWQWSQSKKQAASPAPNAPASSPAAPAVDDPVSPPPTQESRGNGEVLDG